MGLTAQERAELRSNVERRSAAPVGWIVLALVLGFAALAAIFATRGGTDGLSSPWNVVLPFIPFAVFAAFFVPLLIRLRKRGPGPLVDGADPATRKAVLRAITAGSSTDERIDDLVVDLRDAGTARQLGWTAAALCAGGVGVAAAAVIGEETFARVLLGGSAAALLTAAVLLLRRRRQLLGYRPGGVPAGSRGGTPTDAPAAGRPVPLAGPAAGQPVPLAGPAAGRPVPLAGEDPARSPGGTPTDTDDRTPLPAPGDTEAGGGPPAAAKGD
ncbi:hypothetical protein [Asanoa siamensis]|uniref:Uncharacterized protein n=1 Tax=Asanoa siamensis TaxID=926357 RepID=A0ABQ4CZY8_9ACTN|nr:hypothetical protein [Asanoa siamensis]GIF76402.1 hypothetical protein Asi02nite_59200 [Asanoa siamensis]